MNHAIRKVQEKDIDACVNVIRASFQTVADEFGFTEENACELNNLCVLPDYRHKGIGEALLSDAFSRAGILGCVRMNAGIVEENQVLRKWYEDFGFIHLGCKKYDFFPFTCGYMAKELL